MEDIKALTGQRDGLAQYIYKYSGIELYVNYCCPEMEAGRCPFRDRPYDTSRTIDVCVPCIIKMLDTGAHTPPTPFFYLLSKYHMLVTFIDVRGVKVTGRVLSVENQAIVFEVTGKPKRYYLDDIDAIIPREVLRWSHGSLNPVVSQSLETDQQPIPQGDVSACLKSIGVQPHMEGAPDLEAAVRLVLEDSTLLDSILERLYPAVAEVVKKKPNTVATHILKLISTLRQESQNTGNYYSFYSKITGRAVNLKSFLRTFLAYAQLSPKPSQAPGTDKQNSCKR